MAFICTALYGQHTVRDSNHLNTGAVKALRDVTILTSPCKACIPPPQFSGENIQRMHFPQADLERTTMDSMASISLYIITRIINQRIP
ncbi:hypothetical protein CLV59_10730 [Chitinophaga dinghuensis]|uniref:Uncharacterized protein n=1 Tax=Chitinophaga dinghuensis TaxID=1539050 RepID=A0A327VS50_9BACT|nr:hypothetical protein CLV59_10730 [Chitinophaga dinghuensis]